MAQTATQTDLPTATWRVDPIHSSATFAIEHGGLALFRGSFKDLEAELATGEETVLTGAVPVESIDVEDENIRPHLLSPEFFDASRHPEVRFRSTEVAIDGEDIRVTGELEIAGNTREIRANGQLRGPLEGPGGVEKIALALHAEIDRTTFGMDWQMDLPAGGKALANEVALSVDLELARE